MMAATLVAHIAARYAKTPFLVLALCFLLCLSLVTAPVFAGAAELSDNSYLESLDITGVDIDPMFRKTTLFYEASVAEVTDVVEVLAVPEDPDAEVAIVGNTGLVAGANTIEVTVTAADSTQTIYTITVLRAGTVASSDASLARLSVRDYSLTPYFEKHVFEYRAEVPYDVETVEVIAQANNPDASVTITGNDTLALGDNQIIVRVTAPDGQTEQTYTILINKMEEPDETGYKRDIAKRTILSYAPWVLGAGVLIGMLAYAVRRIKRRSAKI